MEFLLREVTTEQDQVVYQDTELDADIVTIGSAADQLIQLRGVGIARAQAVIKQIAGQLTITALEKNTILVNGQAVKTSPLAVGDEVVLASHRIKIASPPAGFDAACELFIDHDLQNHALESAYRTTLAHTALGKRVPAYLLSLLMVLVMLVWPVSAYFLRDNPIDATTGQVQYDKSGAGDKLWSTGPLLPAHQLEIGDDCSACHKVAFQKVQDQSCIDCHQSVSDHFDYGDKQTADGVHGGTLGTLHINLGVTECQSCHKEHNEPAAMVVSADSLCVDCHKSTLKLSDKTLGTDTVTGFDKLTHPEFKLSYLLPKVVEKGTGTDVEWYSRIAKPDSGQPDLSNLKFPHDVHLDPSKVQVSGADQGMMCSNCHTLKSDKEHFDDITMEKHCASCHDLAFDVAAPERELPHGDPRSIVETIQAHFVRVYTDPDYKPLGADRQRRRPGHSGGVERCDDKPFACGMKRATKEASIQFTQRGCITCHEVSDNNSEDLFARWVVLPVKINHDWYGRAQFDHASHLTQRGQTETQVCSSCHEASKSTASTDILIPNIENCQSCHGDRSVKNKVAVDCVSCHAFHPETKKI